MLGGGRPSPLACSCHLLVQPCREAAHEERLVGPGSDAIVEGAVTARRGRGGPAALGEGGGEEVGLGEGSIGLMWRETSPQHFQGERNGAYNRRHVDWYHRGEARGWVA